jgi:predicted metalloprotease with PDZ domain
MRRLATRCLFAALFIAVATPLWAQAPVRYRLSFPEREHHLMQVEITFPDVPAGPLEARMSRSSPGRYALHDFAKNVFDVKATDDQGRPLAVTRPNPFQWTVSGHTGTVRLSYKVFGDRTDGTYLGIDSTHAHINMPAAIMWARGFENRAASVRFEPPPGVSWRVATQLLPGQDSLTFIAPSLQYLMDSPAEFGTFDLRTFTLSDDNRTPVFRVAVHHTGTDAEVDAFARDVESIVREARNVFGEYAPYDGNTYTFLADYLPWAHADGMEHRNSTVLTSSSSLRVDRMDLLDTAAHEFFHSWNVERIRPKSLEPFNLDDVNMSSELWLAEGFTSYFAPLITLRAGLTSLDDFTRELTRTLNTVLTSPGRGLRSPVEMSQLAPFVDAATSVDPTNFDNTFVSYYTWGSAIGLGLDLTLRDRTGGRASLDRFMRVMWERHGRTPAAVAGLVTNPYTLADVEAALALVSDDAEFAKEFFARFVHGRELMDYETLLSKAGLVLRPVAAGRAFAGDLRLEDRAGRVRVAAPVPYESPAYRAGLENEDVIVSVGGSRVASASDVEKAVSSRKPGTSLQVVFERRGQPVTSVMQLVEDPRREVVAAEQAGKALTDGQRRFRQQWITSLYRNTF